MNDRSRTRSIRRRKWSSATNDSKSMLVLAFGSNACTPCIAASFLKKRADRNATAPETRTNAKNKAESETDEVLFFNRPDELLRHNRDHKRVYAAAVFHDCPFIGRAHGP